MKSRCLVRAGWRDA